VKKAATSTNKGARIGAMVGLAFGALAGAFLGLLGPTAACILLGVVFAVGGSFTGGHLADG
jgi:hypothetical protein